MAKVFISYSRKDIDFAKKLTEELQKSDLDFWIDWEGIPPTVDWWKEIEKGIEETDIFLFLISPDSVESKICGQEIATAVKNGKRIIPIVVREIEWQDAPPQLGHLNYIFFSRDDDFDAAAKKLITAIQTDYEWAGTHRRLQVKALEWERNQKEKSFLLRGKDLQDAEFQLAANTSKEPHPTDLQREYVFNSRNAVDRQRRITTGISIVTTIALAALAVFGFYQANVAKRESRISRSGELAAQAELLISKNLQGSTSLLLALEAMHSISGLPYAETLSAQQALYDAIPYVNGKPLTGYSGPISSLAFSPDGRWLATASKGDNDLILWDMQDETSSPMKLAGHTQPINKVLFSPDGSWVATGSADNTLRLWNVHDFSDTEIVFNGHNGSINTLAFSPDGDWLASGSDDGTAQLYKPQSPSAKPAILQEHGGGVNILIFSPNGQWLATGSDDLTIRIWDMQSPDHRSTPLIGHTQLVSSLAFSPDSNWLASGSWDGTVRLWDLTDPTTDPLILPDIDFQAITQLAFSPDGYWLVIASGSKILRLWNMQEPLTDPLQLGGHVAAINSLAFSPDGHWLATGSADRSCLIWNVEDPNIAVPIELDLKGHDSAINAVAFSPDNRTLATGDENNIIRLWDILDPSSNPTTLQGPEDVIYGMVFSPDGRRLATGSVEGGILLWELGDHTNRLMPSGHTGPISSISLSPNGQWLAAGNYNDNTVLLWDLEAAESPPRRLDAAASVYAITFSKDGQQIYTAGADNTVQLWNVDDPSTSTTLIQSQDEVITRIAFSRNGDWLATDNIADSNVRLWNIAGNSSTPVLLEGMEGIITSLAFGSADRWLAVGVDNGTIYLWDITAPSEPSIALLGNVDGISALTFSTDDRRLISGSYDNSARLWDLDNIQNAPIILLGNAGGISALAFSPDGRSLATANFDTTINLWDTDLSEIIQDACKVVGRNLTRSEWRQFGFTESYRATCPEWPVDNNEQ